MPQAGKQPCHLPTPTTRTDRLDCKVSTHFGRKVVHRRATRDHDLRIHAKFRRHKNMCESERAILCGQSCDGWHSVFWHRELQARIFMDELVPKGCQSMFRIQDRLDGFGSTDVWATRTTRSVKSTQAHLCGWNCAVLHPIEILISRTEVLTRCCLSIWSLHDCLWLRMESTP